eukprot:jgi/Chlat1/481/Chrsp103S01087
MPVRQAAVVSAPGKVLLSGGYLVLERPNAGLVLSTSARFYAIITQAHKPDRQASPSEGVITVRVESPQLASVTQYALDMDTFSLMPMLVDPSASAESICNTYVEYAIECATVAAALLLPDASDELKARMADVNVTILGDNDFYSQRAQLAARKLELSTEALAMLPPFMQTTFNASSDENVPHVAKTGLGSSAAMVTAVVASLLHYLGAVSLDKESIDSTPHHRTVVHRVSQAAHCLAQGKVGSGFDVSAAVYGSQRYVRFAADVLSIPKKASIKMRTLELLAGMQLQPDSDMPGSKSWNEIRKKFELPPGLELMVGEPGWGGTSTPSMVGAVQRWRTSQPAEAAKLWTALASTNTTIESLLCKLQEEAAGWSDAYSAVITACAEDTAPSWTSCPTAQSSTFANTVADTLAALHQASLDARRLLKSMGDRAGVPIEPDVQTELLDATAAMPGVVMSGVPGAGGYDAVFAVVLREGSARERVAALWKGKGVLALQVMEQPDGVRLEAADPRHHDWGP